MKRCKECQAWLEDNAVKCNECSAPVVAIEAPKVSVPISPKIDKVDKKKDKKKGR